MKKLTPHRKYRKGYRDVTSCTTLSPSKYLMNMIYAKNASILYRSMPALHQTMRTRRMNVSCRRYDIRQVLLYISNASRVSPVWRIPRDDVVPHLPRRHPINVISRRTSRELINTADRTISTSEKKRTLNTIQRRTRDITRYASRDTPHTRAHDTTA